MANEIKYTEIKSISGKPLADIKARNLYYYDCETINITSKDCFITKNNSDGTCTITGFLPNKFKNLYPNLVDEKNGIIEKVVIPVRIRGYVATKIDMKDGMVNAHGGNFTKIKEIIMPNSIIEFTSFVFSFADSDNDNDSNILEKIKLSKNLINIPDRAFKGCYKLTNLELPNSIESIGFEAFSNCDSLFNSELIIPDSVKLIDALAFSNNPGIKYVCSVDDLYVTNNEVNTEDSPYLKANKKYVNNCLYLNHSQNISTKMFDSCSNIQHIVIPNGVKSIALDAFNNCDIYIDSDGKKQTNNFEITIPQSVIDISLNSKNTVDVKHINAKNIYVEPNSYAEQWCKDNNRNYEYVYNLDNTNNSNNTNENYFEYEVNSGNISCTITKYIGPIDLKIINIPEKINNYLVTDIGDNFLQVTTSNGVVDSDDYLCSCIIMPDSIMRIGQACFNNLRNLASIKFSNSLKVIKKGCFNNIGYDVNNFTITLPDSLECIGSHCFGNCNITKITCGSQLRTIGHDTFYNCSNIIIDLSLSVVLGTEHFNDPDDSNYFVYSEDNPDNTNMNIYLPNSFATNINNYFVYGFNHANQKMEIAYPLTGVTFYVEHGSSAEQWCKDNNRNYMLTNVKPFYVQNNDYLEYNISNITYNFKNRNNNDIDDINNTNVNNWDAYKIGQINLEELNIDNLKEWRLEAAYYYEYANCSCYIIANKKILSNSCNLIQIGQSTYIGIDENGNIYGAYNSNDNGYTNTTTAFAYLKLIKNKELPIILK